jgi:Fe-S cluster biogenesis protein NfuA
MTVTEAVEAALSELRPSLAEDGFELSLRDIIDGEASIVLTALPAACGDCLVPDDMLRSILHSAITSRTTDVSAVALLKVGFDASGHA